MAEGAILDIFNEGIRLILTVSAPMLLGALLVGLIIAIFQATTQIQEPTLAFVPKILVVFGLIILLGPWMVGMLKNYIMNVFEVILQMTV